MKETVVMPKRYQSNFLWIIFMIIAWYIFISAIAQLLFDSGLNHVNTSPAMRFVLEYYTSVISNIIVLFFLTWCWKHNRFVWKSLLPASAASLESEDPADQTAEYYGRGNNKFKMLLLGLLFGFVTNFFAIACALIHGDIKLYYDFSLTQIPFMLFALVSVLIQSASEEMWCRGLMYERLHERYPLWFVFLINGVFFGLLHSFNPGVTVLSIVSIAICGISYSILRWYSGSIWVAFGIHTGWNFTQNFLFGLPNSGLVSEASVFHLDAATGISNLVYDYGFGVEGALPAIFADLMVAVICLYLAKKSGRLGELKLTRVQAFEAMNADA